MSSLPSHTQVLVIGGGPAGSYIASALAREGFQVCLLESASFPRYHIGESTLPSLRPFLNFIGAEDKVINHGFTVKPGAAFKFNQHNREGYTDFSIGPGKTAWNVIRSEFDHLLLLHSQECGAQVFEQTRVESLEFDQDRPVRARFKRNAVEGVISFDYLVDASGRAGIMSTRYLKNRQMNASLRNVAIWAYWRNTKQYMPGTNRYNAPWFEALTDETGWAWFIPLHDGTTSVGIVMDMDTSNERKKKCGHTIHDHYLAQFKLAPGLEKLVEGAELVYEGSKSPVHSASDFSYSATNYAGPNYRLVGDASAFIDPLFSSGLHLALTGAFSAALSIAASIRGHCSEIDAARFHDLKVGTAYTRFLLVVMGAYKQIRNQEAAVLSEVNEDNFDHAFDMIRPVIQGTADVDHRLTEDELQRTMDFVAHVLVTPTDPEMVDTVKARLPEDLFSATGQIMLEDDINKLVAPGDEDAKYVLRVVNARKPIHNMYAGPVHLANETVNGLMGVALRGRLGLKMVA